MLSHNISQLTINISNDFAYSPNGLVLNLDGGALKHIGQILESIEKHPSINRIILYHSEMSVRQVAKDIMRIFDSKVFLEFTHYFQYSEMQTPIYKKVIKPLTNSANRNNMMLNTVHKLALKGLKQHQVYNII